jgi:hypothetical protein
MLARLLSRLPSLGDALYVGGAGAILYGVAQFSRPAAWILLGLMLLGLGYLKGLREGSS